MEASLKHVSTKYYCGTLRHRFIHIYIVIYIDALRKTFAERLTKWDFYILKFATTVLDWVRLIEVNG